ncbi:MAG: hypothetical protein ACETWM_18485 [Candidatus Lokiarchaeia archaeon]
MPKKRRASKRKSRTTALVGALLLLLAIFIPSFAIGFIAPPPYYFPQFTGGIKWPWLELISVIILIMGILALIGILIDAGDVSMVLILLAGIIGLILGIIGLFSLWAQGYIFALAPACAILGGLLALLGAIRVRV